MSELNFKGKEFVYNHHLTVPHRPLVPDADKSVGAPRLEGNQIAHVLGQRGFSCLMQKPPNASWKLPSSKTRLRAWPIWQVKALWHEP